MPEHHGEMLKRRIDRSSLTVKEILERSGVAKTSLYEMYEKPELLTSKILPILKVLKVHPEDFFRGKAESLVADDGVGNVTNMQLSQIINLCKKQIELQEEMVALMKRKK